MSAQYEEISQPAAVTHAAAEPQLEVTSSRSWLRVPPPAMVEFPSGNVALLRKPQLLGMMKRGEIPNPLLDAALDHVGGKPSTDYAKTAEFVDFLVSVTFVSPSVILEGDPGEGELHVDEISDDDKKFAVSWAQQGARAAAQFRGVRNERAGDPGSGDGGDLRDPAEHGARD